MARTTTMTVRVSGALSDFVASNVDGEGQYENISEYVRDLIRQDKARQEGIRFERLQAELAHAFSAPDSTYRTLSATDIISRNRR